MRRRTAWTAGLAGVGVVVAGAVVALERAAGPIDLPAVQDSRISTVSVDDGVEAEVGFVSMEPDASVDQVAAVLADLDARTAAGEVDEWTLFLGPGTFDRGAPTDVTTF